MIPDAGSFSNFVASTDCFIGVLSKYFVGCSSIFVYFVAKADENTVSFTKVLNKYCAS